MDNLRQLLVAVAALTLLFSAVSGANPNYFLGYTAFADEGEDDEGDNSGSSEYDEEDHDDSDRHESDESDDEQTVHATFGESSNVELEIDDEIEDDSDAGSVEAELEVETEDGDLPNGEHEVSFSCEAPDMENTFDGSLLVEDGKGDFKAELALVNGTTYEGCEVAIGDLAVDLPAFTVIVGADDDDEEKVRENGRGHADDDDDSEDDDNVRGRGHGHRAELESEDGAVEIEVEMDTNMTNGTYDVVLTCEEPSVDMTIEDSFEVEDGEGKFETEISLAAGTYEGCKLQSGDELIAELDTFAVRADDDDDDGDDDVEEKRKEKRKEIVSRINAAAEHTRRINANPSSTGDYEPRWNYTLTAIGTATARVDDDAEELIESSVNSTGATNSTTLEVLGDAEVEVEVDMSVWKSNRALILLSVLNGTVVVDGETYTVELGYALYSVSHDAMRIGAFVSDEDGNIYKLKLRGTATGEDAEFPMASGESVEMTFEGNSGPARNSFSAWNLELEGTVEAE